MGTDQADEQDRSDMARLASGQDEALSRLMDRHALRLFHFLIRQLGDEQDAADLAQETFVRIYKNRARFQPQSRFVTWLFTIAANLARDRHRWRARHPQVSLESDSDPDGTQWRDQLPSAQPDPGAALAGEEQTRAVREAVSALPEDERLPLVLAVDEGLSQKEIAQVLNCTPKAVEMRIYRARQKLETALAAFLKP